MRVARSVLLLVLVCAPVFFFRLGRPGLGDPDEGRNSEVAREMLVTGDWITPRMDGVVYLDKPPVFFWTVAASMGLLGANELAARLPSALAALATIALTFLFVRRRLGPEAAWPAAVALAVTPLYIVFGRLVIFDMSLTFWMTLAVLAAFAAIESPAPRRAPGLLFFAAAGIGTITKGPVALIVPLLVAVVWSFARGRPRALGRLRFGTGAVVFFALIVPWLALAEARNPGYLQYAIVGENLERMTSNRFETARPFFFYVHIVLPGLFPWIVLCLVAAAGRVRRGLSGRRLPEAARLLRARLASESDPARLVTAFAAVWLTTLLLFFSAIASKRPSYMLPCAVPVAILTGRLWSGLFGARRDADADSAAARHAAVRSGIVVLAFLCAAAGAVALLAGPLGLARGLSHGKYDELLSRPFLFGGTGAALLLAAGALFSLRRLGRPTAAFAACALSIATVVPLSHAASAWLDDARSSRPMSRFLAAHLLPDDLVICYEQYRPGLNFYLRRPIYLVTSGTPFSSWWVMRHQDTIRRDPKSPLLTVAQLQGLLASPAPHLYVVAPLRMYDRLRSDAGEALRPDPIYEDLGAGVFVRTQSPGEHLARR